MPQLLTWINRPHGKLTYRMTQLITGHGCFAACLHMIGKLSTPSCGFCGIGTDNAQHTLQECTAWDVERDLLKNTIRKNLSLRTVINKVLQSKENWTAFIKFCEIVMLKKEEKEREKKVLRG